MRFRFFAQLALSVCLSTLLPHCSSHYGVVSYEKAPQIINVSEWDPKEKQRSGRSFSPLNQSALRENGSLAMIARCAKGPHIDTKCADFLVGAERQGSLLGSYYYVRPGEAASTQANRFLKVLKNIKYSRGLRTPSILLVADFDTKCSAPLMAGFVQHIHRRTGIHPVVYLENSDRIRRTLNAATASQKATLRRCPYWLALYSNTHETLTTPKQLTQASGVWNDWAMWQYGGVFWENGHSKPYHYQQGSWITPRYFGNLDRPLERSGFNGSHKEFLAFWKQHSWNW